MTGLAWDVVRVSPRAQGQQGAGRRRLESSADRAAVSDCSPPACADVDPAAPAVRRPLLGRDRGAAPPSPARRRSRCSRRGRWPTRCGRPASSASAAPTSPGCSRSTTWTAALRMVDEFEPPELSLGQQVSLAVAVIRACGLVVPPPVPATELRLRGQRHTIGRDRRAVRHHYDVGNEFFALFLDRSMTYSCAYFAGGAETLEEAQEAKLELVCKKLASARGRARARRRLRLGELRDPRRDPPRGARGRDHARPSVRLSWPANGFARPASPTGSRSASPTTARCPTGRSTRSPASGWSSTWGRSRSTSTPSACGACCRPAGGCSTTGSPSSRTSTAPDEGAFSERFVFPDGVPLPLSRVLQRTRARRVHDDPRRGAPERLREDDRLLDRAVRRALGRRRTPRGHRARPDLAAVPARRPAGLRDRLGVGLPGSGAPLTAAPFVRLRTAACRRALPDARAPLHSDAAGWSMVAFAQQTWKGEA